MTKYITKKYIQLKFKNFFCPTGYLLLEQMKHNLIYHILKDPPCFKINSALNEIFNEKN